MRDIKFRGKRIDNGEWVYGALINNMFFKAGTNQPVPYIIDPSQFKDYDSFEDTEYLAVEVDPETVGQYTGLKDRNGKEIYEGDILDISEKIDDGYIAYSDHVVFEHGSFQLATEDPFLYEVAPRCEVIGNIYDNPELLRTC